MAVGFIKATREAGLKVPEDVVVIGFEIKRHRRRGIQPIHYTSTKKTDGMLRPRTLAETPCRLKRGRV